MWIVANKGLELEKLTQARDICCLIPLQIQKDQSSPDTFGKAVALLLPSSQILLKT